VLPTGDRRDFSISVKLQWLACVFFASIPYENLNFNSATFSSIPKIVGFLLASYCLLHRRILSRGWHPAVACWLLFWQVDLLCSLAQPGLHWDTEGWPALMRLFQNIALMWICCGLFRNEGLARRLMLLFALGTVGTAVCMGLGVATSEVAMGDRLVFGDESNANMVAHRLAFAAVILVGMVFMSKRRGPLQRSLLLAFAATLFSAMILTGSRGNVVAFLAALATLVLEKERTRRLAIRGGIIALCFAAAFAALKSDYLKDRILSTITEGDLAGRDLIYPVVLELIQEKPLLGWGENNAREELAGRTVLRCGKLLDQHNEWLWVLSSSGIVGAVPVLFGMAMTLSAAWRARGGPRGALPLALLIAVLVETMTSGLQGTKTQWIAFAYALTAGGPQASPAVIAPCPARQPRSPRQAGRDESVLVGPKATPA
jgi:O-antigen ligase